MLFSSSLLYTHTNTRTHARAHAHAHAHAHTHKHKQINQGFQFGKTDTKSSGWMKYQMDPHKIWANQRDTLNQERVYCRHGRILPRDKVGFWKKPDPCETAVGKKNEKNETKRRLSGHSWKQSFILPIIVALREGGEENISALLWNTKNWNRNRENWNIFLIYFEEELL